MFRLRLRFASLSGNNSDFGCSNCNYRILCRPLVELNCVGGSLVRVIPCHYPAQLSSRDTGCGMISSWFVSDLMLPRSDSCPRHKLQAVGSSSVEKAREFVQTNAPAASPFLYPSYDDVFNDSNVDIVYIGTPHSCHYENAFAAIQAGKNVLCEKPLTINARQAESLITVAREKNVYLMEGACLEQ